ncbi:HalOD1 output domain-containing protein [Haladaptatus sp. NG-SE-30]
MNNGESEDGDVRTRTTNRVTSRPPPSIQIINAVSDATDCPVEELDPLYDAIDPDALDRLYSPTYHGDVRSGGEVTFLYAGYQVVVDGSGTVELTPIKS